MRHLLFPILIMLCMAALATAAPNDPGHDTLYIESTGNSTLTGQLNISSVLRVAGQTEVSSLILYGDGTEPGTGTYVAAAAGGTDWLRFDAPGNMHLKYGGGDQVVVGSGTLTDLNVTGRIYSGNALVCLSNGTNCPGGNNTGNVSSVNAGNGITVTNPNGPVVTVSTNATTCGASEYSYWTGSAWSCRADANSGGTGNISGAGTSGTIAKFTAAGTVGNSILSESGSNLTVNGNITMPSSFWIGGGGSVGSSSVAVGGSARANGTSAAAFGTNAQATAQSSAAIGVSAAASKTWSVAVGSQSAASGRDSTALGAQAVASADGSTAVGGVAQDYVENAQGAVASGSYSVAVGAGAQATATSTTVMGVWASSNATDSSAIGYNAHAYHPYSVALGANAVTTTTNQLMIGAAGSYALNTLINGNLSAYALYENSSRVCTAANGLCASTGDNSSWNESYADTQYVSRDTWTSIDSYPAGCGAGQAVQVIGDTLTCISVGGSGNITGNGASTDNAIARWNGAGGNSVQNSLVTIDDTGNLAGVGNITTGTNFFIGSGAAASNASAIAIGEGATAQGAYSTALGWYAWTKPTGEFAMAIGGSTTADGDYALALGGGSSAIGHASVAIGYALVNGTHSIGIGDNAIANSTNSTAIGANASASGISSIAMGNWARSWHDNSIALGRDAQTTAANQLMVGSSGYNLNTQIFGTLNTSGNLYENNARVCTASNGLCASGGGSGGWTNTSSLVSLYSNTTNVSVGSTPTLFVDNTNGRVGINNSAPGAVLDIQGGTNGRAWMRTNNGGWYIYNSTGDFRAAFYDGGPSIGTQIYADGNNGLNPYMTLKGGNVGIGTTAPTAALHVQGSGSSSYQGIQVQDTFANNVAKGAVSIIGARYANANAPFVGFATWDDNAGRYLYIGGGGWTMPDATHIEFYTASTYNETNDTGILRMSIDKSGNTTIDSGTFFVDAVNNRAGIGTVSPTQKLDVNGSGNFSGTNAALYVNGSQVCTAANGLCGGTTAAFNTITSGTNTVAAMVVGTGASITTSGSGTINANQLNSQASTYYLNQTGFTAANITSGTIADARIASAATWNAKAGTGNCAAGQVVMNTTSSGVQCVALSTGTVTGSGAAGNISYWTSGSALASSVIYQSGSSIGIGTASPMAKLDIAGAIKAEAGITSNMIRDPQFNDMSAWTGEGANTQIPVQLPTGEYVQGMEINTSTNTIVRSDYIPVDNEKTYRFRIWMSTNDTATGVHYFGLYCFNSAKTMVNCSTVTGTDTSNPYFWSGDAGAADTFFPLTGYLFPTGSVSWTSPNDTTSANFAMKSDVEYVQLRFLHYPGGTATVSSVFAMPSVEEVQEGSIWGLRTTMTNTYAILMPTVNVGIGTNAPAQKLDVNGNLAIAGTTRISSTGVGTFATGTTVNSQDICLADGTNCPVTGAPSAAAGWTNTSTVIYTTDNADNVSIGASSPAGNKLYVVGNIKATTSIDTDTQFLGQPSDTVSAPSYSWTGDTNVGMYRPTTDVIGFTTAGAERARIDASGNVAIGTTSATQKLTVNGSINVSGPGNIYYQGNLTGYGADLAEYVFGEGVEAGDVVILDPNADKRVVKAAMPYDTRVAGIISTDPSHLMSADEGNVPLALAGRVPVKVTSEGGAIRRGDLLTTSSTPGHAMRCADRQSCSGAIVGKAMEGFNATQGMITALVVLG